MTKGVNTRTFYVYPNPIRGEVYIDLISSNLTASYEILNKKGQVVRKSNDLILKNTISLKALPADMYTLKVKSESRVMIKKFLRL